MIALPALCFHLCQFTCHIRSASEESMDCQPVKWSVIFWLKCIEVSWVCLLIAPSLYCFEMALILSSHLQFLHGQHIISFIINQVHCCLSTLSDQSPRLAHTCIKEIVLHRKKRLNRGFHEENSKCSIIF